MPPPFRSRRPADLGVGPTLAQQVPQLPQLRRVMAPSPDRVAVERFTHLHDAGSGHRGLVGFEGQAGRIPRQPAKFQQLPDAAFQVVDDRLVADLQDASWQRLLPVFHQAIELQVVARSEEHTSELQSLMRISYAVFCLKKTTKT